MLHKMRSRGEIGRKVSPPQPVFMSDDQKSDYLSKLRNNRPARPAGSRPLPSKTASAPVLNHDLPNPPTETALAPGTEDNQSLTTPSEVREPPRSTSPLPAQGQDHPIVNVDSSVKSRTSVGRPLAAGPRQNPYSIRGRKVSPTAVVEMPTRSSSADYRESGARWLERQEAISLREALAEMDTQDEDKRIHDAAQDEAADLVWRHRNPQAAEDEKNTPYANPDAKHQEKHRFTAHLAKGAYARSHGSTDIVAKGSLPLSDSLRSSSNRSTFAARNQKNDHHNHSKTDGHEETTQSDHVQGTSASKSVSSSQDIFNSSSSGQRKTSNGSSKSGFPNPVDQIYEDLGNDSMTIEKEAFLTSTTPGPLRSANRNALRGARPLPGRPCGQKTNMVSQVDIHKNPPTQSRSAAYTRNNLRQSIDVIPEAESTPSKDGVEIRGDDIRAATSMKMKDRSPKLPLPTAVSDVPGRPIVSFDPKWRAGRSTKPDSRDAVRPDPSPVTGTPAATVSAPVVPTISVSGLEEPSAPLINITDENTIPAITVSTEDTPVTPAHVRPPPRSRPLPVPSRTAPAKVPNAKTPSRLPWLNPSSRATSVPTATCASCALPIAGRIVTASGAGASASTLKARFHPECFTCHHCSTALECVAFYPEPEDKRLKRLEADDLVDHADGSELRFYCHLDFHEFFSPRCRSCKTPIEGEVIVAAGAEWHVGHFFCAECGNPFDSTTPFVEKDNYAYCVSCHTRRTSARCKACKKQILDEMTVQALGGQWHGDCFHCYECGGGFGDDGRFFVRNVTVEGTEKEKRRGVATKTEERAVCEACERCRLKS